MSMEYHEHLKNRFIQLSKPLQPLPTEAEPQLQELHGIKVICYDFYGTLFVSAAGDIGVDDGNFNANLFKEALVHTNIHLLSNDAGNRGLQIYNEVIKEHQERLKQDGLDYPEPDIRRVWLDVLLKMKHEELIEEPDKAEQIELLAVEFEARMNPVWPMPQASEVLHFFREKHIPQGLISNSQFYTPLLLEALFLRTLPELGLDQNLMQWSFEERQKKPSLTLFKKFIEKTQQLDEAPEPSAILYVGNDMLKDIYPASECGMKTALFAGDQRSLKWRRDDDRCTHLKPDLVLTSLAQLMEYINPESD